MEATTDVETVYDQQQKMNEAKATLIGNVPLIESPGRNGLSLARGVYVNGQWVKEAGVRELTGVDEEVIARQVTVFDFYDSILALGTVKLGLDDLSESTLVEKKGKLAPLLVGERDQLFIAISSLTFGDDRNLAFTCPSCGYEGEVLIHLREDLAVEDVTDPQLSYKITVSNKDVVEVRPLTGAEQNIIATRRGITQAEVKTLQISECLVSVNGQTPLDPASYVRNLPLRDREAILKEMEKHQPMVDYDVAFECDACASRVERTLSLEDIFRI